LACVKGKTPVADAKKKKKKRIDINKRGFCGWFVVVRVEGRVWVWVWGIECEKSETGVWLLFFCFLLFW
jgi:hypothetical protein